MPAVTFARFFANHGLLEYGNQPDWRTVDGGSQALRRRHPGPARAAAVRLDEPVTKITRTRRRGRAPHRRRARSGSTTSWWPPTATRPSTCCPTRRPPSARCSGPSATRPTGPRCTPTTASCRPTAGPGPAGTTTGSPTSPTGATLTYRLRSLQGIASPGRAAGHPQPRRRHRPGHGCCARSTTPTRSSTSPPSPPSARHEELNGARPHLVLRRLLGLRLPRGRRAERPGRLPPAGRRGPVTAAGPGPGPAGRRRRAGHRRCAAPSTRAGWPTTGTPRSTTGSPTGSPWSCLDLAEVDAVCRLHPLWSDERPNAVTFRRRDYLGDPSVPLDARRAGPGGGRAPAPGRPDRSPCSPSCAPGAGCSTRSRTYYCYDPTGTTVETTVRRGDQHPVARAHRLRAARPRGPPGGQGACTSRRSCPWTSTHRFTVGEPGRAPDAGRRRLPRRRAGVRRLDGAHPAARPAAGPRAGCCGGSRS